MFTSYVDAKSAVLDLLALMIDSNRVHARQLGLERHCVLATTNVLHFVIQCLVVRAGDLNQELL